MGKKGRFDRPPPLHGPNRHVGPELKALPIRATIDVALESLPKLAPEIEGNKPFMDLTEQIARSVYMHLNTGKRVSVLLKTRNGDDVETMIKSEPGDVSVVRYPKRNSAQALALRNVVEMTICRLRAEDK